MFQYLDHSAARAGVDHPFYGLGTPDVAVVDFDTAGVTPRYLESLASKTLLVGDLPPGESESWYADKMAVVSLEASDDELADELDRWIRDDAARDDGRRARVRRDASHRDLGAHGRGARRRDRRTS